MTGSHKDEFLTLEKIKRGLDPAFSYMIFERSSRAGPEEAFREVIEALSRMDFGFYERQLLRIDEGGRLLLVVKFGPGRMDETMQEFLNVGLPKDITFYAYGSHKAG